VATFLLKVALPTLLTMLLGLGAEIDSKTCLEAFFVFICET